MSEERVLRALRELREADAGREAPQAVETLLVRAFEKRARARRARRAVKIAAAAVLAAGAAGVWRGITRPVLTMKVEAPAPPRPPTIAAATPMDKAKPQPELREVVTQFYPLMDVPPPTTSGGQLVRVDVPVSALENAGFQVAGARPEDRIPADVWVGEEGLARAIRFVSYER